MVIVYLYIRTRLLTRWLIKMIFKNSNAVFPSAFIYLFIYFFRVSAVFSVISIF